MKEQLCDRAQQIHKRCAQFETHVSVLTHKTVAGGASEDRVGVEENLQEMAASGSWHIKMEKLLFLMKPKV